MAAYRKSITPALVALVGVLGTYIANGELDRVSLAIAIVGALQTSISWLTANVAGYGLAKAVLGALAGTIVAFGTWIQDGTWSRETTATAVTAAVLAIVTWRVPNGGATNHLGSFPTLSPRAVPTPPLEQ